MSENNNFQKECKDEVQIISKDIQFKRLTSNWMNRANLLKYSYHFEFLGRPIIQYPQDIIVLQELIWIVKPDLIIETGIAHGGSLIFYSSMLALLDICDAEDNKNDFKFKPINRKVIGIDIDIRSHNKIAIEKHPMNKRIQILEGSSIDPLIINEVHKIAKNHKKILVCLDSSRSHEHVLAELEAYSSLVSVESYCIVFNTIIEDLQEQLYNDRPWCKGNNPKTAVNSFLKNNSNFSVDMEIINKILITVAPDGYLKRLF